MPFIYPVSIYVHGTLCTPCWLCWWTAVDQKPTFVLLSVQYFHNRFSVDQKAALSLRLWDCVMVTCSYLPVHCLPPALATATGTRTRRLESTALGPASSSSSSAARLSARCAALMRSHRPMGSGRPWLVSRDWGGRGWQVGRCRPAGCGEWWNAAICLWDEVWDATSG